MELTHGKLFLAFNKGSSLNYAISRVLFALLGNWASFGSIWKGPSIYNVSCEPLRVFRKDDTTCSTWVQCMLPNTGWIRGFSTYSGRHAWHSCRASCIVISENPQGLATHMVLTCPFRGRGSNLRQRLCLTEKYLRLRARVGSQKAAWNGARSLWTAP